MLSRLPLSLLSLTPFALLAAQCDQPCCDYARPLQLAVKHIESKGIGYGKGYTTIEGFLVENRLQYNPFIDVRGHIFNDGKWAVNAGAGFRYLCGCRTYGLNAYYDYRRHHHTYQQIGFGFESLGETWEFRANGYVPFGRKKVSSGPLFSKFSGHLAYLKANYEYAMAGADAEAGAHFYQNCNFDLYAGVGAYYFQKRVGGSNAIGGKARVTGWYKDYVSLEVSGSGDAVFHGIVQGEIGFHWPLGPKKCSRTSKCCDPVWLDRSLVRPVARDEIIVLNQHTKSLGIAIDPATGLPYDFIFVNNTSHSNGTFESPYPTLVLAQDNSAPYDIIYVFPGDGTSTGMNAGITMQDNQKLWGSGINQTLITTVGAVTIPAFSTTLPLLTNPGANLSVVTGANYNEVAGIEVDVVSVASGPIDFYNGLSFAGVTNAYVHQNVINVSGIMPVHMMQPPTGVGISFFDCGGQITVVKNVINQTHLSSTALALLSVTADSNTLIDRNQFLADVGGGAQGIEFGKIGTGIGDFNTIQVSNNTFVGQGNSANGVAVGGYGFMGTGYLIVDNNYFTQQTAALTPGPECILFIIPNTGANLTADVISNLWTNNTYEMNTQSLFAATLGGNICIRVQNNVSDVTTANANGVVAYNLSNFTSTTFIAEVSNNVGLISELTVTPGTCP